MSPAPTTALSTPPRLLEDVLIARTTELADQTLRPQADHVAKFGVPRSHLEALGRAGVLGLMTYQPAGPLNNEEVRREVAELVAAADGSTWFVSHQHHQPVKEVAASANRELRDKWLKAMVNGEVFGAEATSHLRRTGSPAVVATPDRLGWRLSGRLPWLTGWFLADVFLVAAVTPDGQVLSMLLPCRTDNGIGEIRPQELWGMNATGTVSVELRDVAVAPDQVIGSTSWDAWLRQDKYDRANVNPGIYGTLRAATDFLVASAPHSGPKYYDLGMALASEGAQLREQTYRLADEFTSEKNLADRQALRAAALELTCRAGTACIAASGATAMITGSTASRLVGEALFHLARGQTAITRTAIANRFIELISR